MNIARKAVRLLLVPSILIGLGTADPAPQSEIRLTRVAEGTWAADWTGVAGETYFFQMSTDLVNWHYAPYIGFGEGEHSNGFSSTSPKYFFRLHHTDIYSSLEDAMNASLSGDGLSNIFKVTYGYDPFSAQSTDDGADNALDPDGDGMTNATENAKGLNPMAKDNPKVKLQVVVY